jgi:integrase
MPSASPINPRFDYDEWKRLLADAKVRDGRLHDARHTAATVPLIFGIPDTAVDGVMGWEPGGAMRRRYQHLTDPVLKAIADKLGHTLWGSPGNSPDGDDDGPGGALASAN